VVIIFLRRIAVWKKFAYAIVHVLMTFDNLVIAVLLKIVAQRKYRQMRQWIAR
jgi:hypothetical protein